MAVATTVTAAMIAVAAMTGTAVTTVVGVKTGVAVIVVATRADADRPHRRDDGYRRDDRRDDRRRDRQPTPYVDTTCQICTIHGHPARDCWWRYDDDRGKKDANFAAHGVDSNWYYDTGATDHITGELNKLTTHDQYHGEDRVRTAEGTCMHISHIGHSLLRTPHNSFTLNSILHVPSASKNLLSVHRFTLDNHVFIEFHPFFFLIKDQET
jgi:hypothetical protein